MDGSRGLAQPDLIKQIEQISWYHTLDLPGGVSTPGFVDNRGCAQLLPFPDLTGKRCLDVGTGNGFWAFHLERFFFYFLSTIEIYTVEQIDWPPGPGSAASRPTSPNATALTRSRASSSPRRRWAPRSSVGHSAFILFLPR